MKYLLSLACCLILSSVYAQGEIYKDEFTSSILSVGNDPNGYTTSISDNNFRITGNGNAGQWAAMSYYFHDGDNNRILIDASDSPKIYIKVKGQNQPSLRIDFQDQTGYVTNQSPIEITLDNSSTIYEYDYTGRMFDGAFGGPCTNAPCVVDATKLQALMLFVNAPTGGYLGDIDIEWISIGAPIEDIDISEMHDIRYNQVSYLTDKDKLVSIVANAPFEDLEYAIYKFGDTTPMIESTISSAGIWQSSGEHVATVNISNINEPGEYTLETTSESITFRVEDDGYEALAEASIKYYYYNRASQELTEEFAGQWSRPLGHPDDVVIVHPSAASQDRPAGSTFSSPKGWYDAGDYNKYIVNSGISTYTLLAAYEHYPTYYDNLSIDIPENGGDIPDLLDEVMWNLDWMLTMQDPSDGGVYHKLTGLNFSGIIMPHQYNADRYVVQKTTSATLNFAAVMAAASRIYEQYESALPGYSAAMLEAAENAYQWAKDNPTIYYNQPNNVSTGEYGDGNVSDEFEWAAAELFITTGNSIYKNDINENSIGNGVPAWPYTAPLALISLAHHEAEISDDINVDVVKNRLVATANLLRGAVQQTAMRVAMGSSNGDFVWGSNGQAGNQIMILIRAYESTLDVSYLDAAYTTMDYLLGRNGTGFCYVSGFGDKSPRNPHHRQSEADNVADPVPGMVAGGPNPGMQDGCSGYIGNSPAQAYVDSWCSYASNEVTINWNAPLAYAVNALRYYQLQVISSTDDFDIPQKELEIHPNPGSGIVYLSQVRAGSNQDLEVLDSSGRTVQRIANISSQQVNLSMLANGLYIVRLVGEDEIRSVKWVKKD